VAVVATELRVLGDREEAEEEQTTVTHSFTVLETGVS